MESIDRDVPVIGLGIVGPHECSVIAGYEDGGAVLRGWSYFQGDPQEYYRSVDWYANCHGLILIGERLPRPPARQVLCDTLDWAITLAHVPQFPGCLPAATPGERRVISGLAAYDAMAAATVRDADYDSLDKDALDLRLYAISNDGIHLMGCKRAAAGRFVQQAAEQLPSGRVPLLAAADLYLQVPSLAAGCAAGPDQYGTRGQAAFDHRALTALRDRALGGPSQGVGRTR